MNLSSKQEKIVAAFMRDVSNNMDRRLGADERARRLGEIRHQVMGKLASLGRQSLEDHELNAILKSAVQTFSPRLPETASAKKFNPNVTLMLTPEDIKWLGVCGGLSAWLGVEPWIIRALFFALSIPLAPLTLIVYFGLYCWMYFHSDKGSTPKFKAYVSAWRFFYLVLLTNLLFHAAAYARDFIFFAHETYLKRAMPPLGEWDWIALWNGSFSNWVLVIGVPFSLLSGTPLKGAWGDSLKRVPWALLSLYFIAITFGIASILVGIILDFVSEFTGDPGFLFRIFDLSR